MLRRAVWYMRVEGFEKSAVAKSYGETDSVHNMRCYL